MQATGKMRNCLSPIIITLFFALAFFVRTAYAEQKLTPQDLIEISYIGGGTLLPKLTMSPQGDALAFAIVTASLEKNRYKIDWYIYELGAERSPIKVGDGGDLMLNIRQRFPAMGALYGMGAKWSPDGEWIGYPLKKDGQIQLWRSSRDGSRQEQLTFGEADVFGSPMYEANFVWSSDGSKIYYEVARSREFMKREIQEEGKRGFLYDDRFFPGHATTPGWVRCGKTRGAEEPSGNQTCVPALLSLNLQSKSVNDASEIEKTEYNSLIRNTDPLFTDEISIRRRLTMASSGAKAWFENLDPDIYQGFDPIMSVRHEDASGNKTICNEQLCVGQFLKGLWFHEDDIIFSHESVLGTRKLGFYRWSPTSGDVTTIIETNDYFEGCQISNDDLICFYETPDHPRQLASLNVEDGLLTILFDANEDLKPRLVSRIEHLSWKDNSGETAAGVLVYPRHYEAGQKYPLVIESGLPSGFLLRASGGELPVHLLSKEGFFVLAASTFINFDTLARLRGEALADAEFKTFDRRQRALRSLQVAVRLLDERGLIDPERIAVTGLSSSAASAKYALIHSDLFALASLSTGYSGPQSYWFAPSYVRSRIRRILDDSLPFEGKFGKYLSAENLGYHARNRVFPPTLMQVADTELSHALFDHVLLKDERHPVEMYVFPDELHIKYRPVHRYNIYRRTVQWMKFWLQGETVDDPLDTGQYQRWSELCSDYVAKLEVSKRPVDRARAKDQLCVLAVDR